MTGRHKLLILWVCMLLVSTLCPAVESKRGGIFRGKGKSDKQSDKQPPSSGHGSSKQGLKLAGAAAAGALGGAAVGFGLGSLGRPKHGYGHAHHKDSSKDNQRYYERESKGYKNQYERRPRASAAAPTRNIFSAMAPVVPFLVGAWVRGL